MNAPKLTALRGFWPFERASDERRFQCLAGCTALELTMLLHWREAIVPEWPETLTFVSALLESPHEFRILSLALGRLKDNSDLRRQLEFFASHRDPTSFTPSLADLALLGMLHHYSWIANPLYTEWTRSLIELHGLRESCLTGNDEHAKRASERGIELLEKLRTDGPRFSPYFPREEAPELRRQAA